VLLLCVHTDLQPSHALHRRYYTPAWEAPARLASPQQPLVSSEASSRQLGQPSAATAATATTTAQLQNKLASTAALQGPTTPPSGQAVSQQHHDAAAKAVSIPPVVQAHSRQGGLSTDKSFYSFEMGGVLFLMLDTESPSEPGSAQGVFVASDLAKVCMYWTRGACGLGKVGQGPCSAACHVQVSRAIHTTGS
jgi:hypothetical protein